MTSVRRALALSFLERYLTIVLALASNIILARLLTPEQIGMYSVSLAAIGLAHALRDFGIGSYLIQEVELTDARIRTAFGVSLLLGGSLFALIFLAAPAVASFYGDSSMTITLRIVSLNFLVLPFCLIAGSLLRRDMQFKRLVAVSVSAAALSFVVTVGLAFAGMGPDSMAIGSVVQNIAIGIGNWAVTPGRKVHRPSLVGWRRLISFGGQTTLVNLINNLAIDANDLVVGKVMGFAPVAVLSRAQGLMNLFNRDLMGAVRSVALPAFAAAHRGSENIASKFRHSLALLCVVAWSFHGLVAIYSHEFIRLMFGPQWDEAARIAPIFSVAGAIGVITSLAPTLLVAVGRIDLVTKSELIAQPTRLAMIVFAALVFSTIQAVAWAYFAVTLMAMPMFLWFAAKGVPGLLHGIAGALRSSLLVCGAVLLPAVLHVGLAGAGRPRPLPMLEVLPVIALCVLSGLVALSLTKHPMTQEPTYIKAMARVRLMLRMGRRPGPPA